MKVKDIIEKLSLKVLSGADLLDTEVTGAYVSDLLSDVMGHASEGELWLTLQSHMNVVAIASLKELAGIVLVKDIQADEMVLAKAKEEEVLLLSTEMSTFELGGKLYELLKG